MVVTEKLSSYLLLSRVFWSLVLPSAGGGGEKGEH